MIEMNKSEIFKFAHNHVKFLKRMHVKGTYRELLSKGLKRAYAVAKDAARKSLEALTVTSSSMINTIVEISDWIIKKNLTSNEATVVINYADCAGTVERETEKAVFVRFNSKMGVVKSWFPKSTLVK